MTQSKAYKSVVAMLQDKRLSEALALLQREAAQSNHAALAADAEQVRDNYARLLEYFKKGIADPTRQDQLDALFAKAWELAERLKSQPLLPSDESLSDEMTLQMIRGYEYSQLEGEDRDRALGRLFSRLRDYSPMPREVRRAIHQLVLDEQVPEYERATLLSAITLNLLQWFDAGMLEQFYTYSLDDQPIQIRVQALLTLALCGIRYDNRIVHEPRLRELYLLLVETEKDALAAIQVTMPYCKESVGFRKRLSNVVKVELGKLRVGREAMPFQEFLNIFQDGIDYDFDFFKLQCQRPFFAQPENEHHWLMPFTLEQHRVKEIISGCPEAKTFITLMMSSMSQTNSSKYAHTLLMAKSFPTLVSQIMEQLKDSPIKIEDLAPLDAFTTLRLYMHDLFRYLSLSDKGKTIANPLMLDADFSFYGCLSEEDEDVDMLEKICQTLYQRKRWMEVLPRLVRLTRKRVTPQLLLHLADAAEHCNDYTTAQEALRRYQALFTFDEALYLRMAQDYEATQSYVAEENTLHEALKQWPDSETLLLQMSKCLNLQQRPSEAMNTLHHVEMLTERTLEHQLRQQMAYAHAQLAQTSEAEEQIVQVLGSDKANMETNLLGIIIALQGGQLTLAAERYAQMMQHSPDLDKERMLKMVTRMAYAIHLPETKLSLLAIINDTTGDQPSEPTD